MSIKCLSCGNPRDFEPNETYAICKECACILFVDISDVLSIVEKIDDKMKNYHTEASNLMTDALKDSTSTTIEEKKVLEKISRYISLKPEFEVMCQSNTSKRREKVGKKLYEFKRIADEIIEFFDRSKE